MNGSPVLAVFITAIFLGILFGAVVAEVLYRLGYRR